MKMYANVQIDEETERLTIYEINDMGVRYACVNISVRLSSDLFNITNMMFNILSNIDDIWLYVDCDEEPYIKFVMGVIITWIKSEKPYINVCINETFDDDLCKLGDHIPSHDNIQKFIEETDLNVFKNKLNKMFNRDID